MPIEARFGDGIETEDVSYNEGETSFRLPVAFDVAGAVDTVPDVEILLEVGQDGDDNLLVTHKGEDVTETPVQLDVSEVALKGDTDRTLYKFVATATSAATFDGPSTVDLILYVNGEEVDRRQKTFWNTIRAY